MFNKMWIKDPKDGKASVTLTAFCVGFLVATFKLLISGMTIHGFKVDSYSGVDFAATIAALGGIYVLRRNTNGDNTK